MKRVREKGRKRYMSMRMGREGILRVRMEEKGAKGREGKRRIGKGGKRKE